MKQPSFCSVVAVRRALFVCIMGVTIFVLYVCPAFALQGRSVSTHEQAQKIMGENFLGIEESVKCLGIDPAPRERAILSAVPFSQNTLKECSETHVLVAVFPISLLDLQGRVEAVGEEDNFFFGKPETRKEYVRETFATERGEVQWCLIRKEFVPKSGDDTWLAQRKLLAANEDIPSARVAVYTIVLSYLASDEKSRQKLFTTTAVRTASVHKNQKGNHVSIGYFRSFDKHPMKFGWDDADKNARLGIISMRKPGT